MSDTVAFDLDGTLAKQETPFSVYSIGEPNPKILRAALDAQEAGPVVCFTARAHSNDPKITKVIRKWLDDHGLTEMKITNKKTPDIKLFYDDRALQVLDGKVVTGKKKASVLNDVDWEAVEASFLASTEDEVSSDLVRKFAMVAPSVSPTPPPKAPQAPTAQDSNPFTPAPKSSTPAAPASPNIAPGSFMQTLKGRRGEGPAQVPAGAPPPLNTYPQTSASVTIGGQPHTVTAPTAQSVQPAWFKLPHYGGQLGPEIDKANTYRQNNSNLFSYEGLPDWTTPIPVNHAPPELVDAQSPGRVVRNVSPAGGGKLNTAPEVQVGPNVPRARELYPNLRAQQVMEHESYHGALEPRVMPKAPEGPLDKLKSFMGGMPATPAYDTDRFLSNHENVELRNTTGERELAHDIDPGEMRNYMSSLQAHQYGQTGQRFETPQQYQEFVKTLPWDAPKEQFKEHIKSLPWDPRRMFDALHTLRQHRPDVFDNIMQWQAKTIPGYVDNTSNVDLSRKIASSKFEDALNKATAAGEVPHDMDFIANDESCIVNAGDWHDSDQIAASMALARKFFDDVVEENECGIPPGYSRVMPSSEARAAGKKKASVIPTTGPHAILHALQNIDMAALKKKAWDDIKSGKVTKRDQGTKLLGVIDGMERNELKPHDLMIRRVPVLPPAFRPYGMIGNTYLPGNANELYGDLFKQRELHKETLDTLGASGAQFTRKNLYSAVKALYGYGDPVSPKLAARGTSGYMTEITGPGSPKYSFAQAKMFAKPQDNVARGAITVAPHYNMNQIGIPKEMAWNMYHSIVQGRLVRGGMNPVDALNATNKRSREAEIALRAEVKERPVIYSRAPAWHKYNTIAGYADLIDGNNIAVSPYVTAGLNADFDGDTINVHVPVLPDSVKEAKEKLMPDKMLFSIKNPDQVVATPKHEAILGMFAAHNRAPRQNLTGRPLSFGSKQEALAAIGRGDVSLQDEVDVPD